MSRVFHSGAARFAALLSVTVLAGGIVVPNALAATSSEEVSNYSASPSISTTSTTSTSEVKPKEEEVKPKKRVTPKHEVKPAKEAVPPVVTTTTSSTATPQARTLPFTGLNLTWLVAAGVALVGGGVALRRVARRAH